MIELKILRLRNGMEQDVWTPRIQMSGEEPQASCLDRAGSPHPGARTVLTSHLNSWRPHILFRSLSRKTLLGIMTLFFWTGTLFWTGATAQAAEQKYIPVGQAKTKKTVLALAPLKATGNNASSAQSIQDVLSNDLLFMDLFSLLNSKAFIEDANAGITLGTFKMSDWSSIGAEFVIKGQLSSDGNVLTLEGYVYQTNSAKMILGKKYVASSKDIRTLAHTFGNDIVESLTGLPGIFLTRIAASCDRTGKKEIYIMDFDGTNVKQITHHKSIALAPAWSPDSTKLAYSLFKQRTDNTRNIDLFELDFLSNKVRLLSNRTGINSGAAYSPDGSKIAMTMSFSGTPSIFTLDLKTRDATRISSSFGVEVDPTWSPDGRNLAFVSSRTGMPMVYTMSASGTNAQRLTFAGRYNATPSWSLQNNKIAFAGWTEGRFDIFIMNPNGSNIERLTKGQGNNEEPHFSPDGNFVVFNSDRTGQKNLYVMNIDGTFTKRISYGLGNCSAPKWSNPPVKGVK